MAKWLTSVVLMAALGGGVLAGTPLHSGEQECGMGGTGGEMDCCAKAHSQTAKPGAVAARLCCAMNCQSSGTTPPTGSVQRTSPIAVLARHPAAVQTPFAAPGAGLLFAAARDHLQNSQPTYIRHLALLI